MLVCVQVSIAPVMSNWVWQHGCVYVIKIHASMWAHGYGMAGFNVAIKLTNLANELRQTFNIGCQWSMHGFEVIKNTN